MKWFNGIAAFLLIMVVCSPAWAGAFDQYIRPLSNPVYNIDPRNETTVRVAHLRQRASLVIEMLRGPTDEPKSRNRVAYQSRRCGFV